jgi:hypothetical protein
LLEPFELFRPCEQIECHGSRITIRSPACTCGASPSSCRLRDPGTHDSSHLFVCPFRPPTLLFPA